MDHRMRLILAPIYCLLLTQFQIHGFIPGIDVYRPAAITNQECLEGGETVLLCDTNTNAKGDVFKLLVWYKEDTPIYSYDATIKREWADESFNRSGRLRINLQRQPTELTITHLAEDDQNFYHCRVDFELTPTRNIGVNLTVIVLPLQPFFLDERENKTEGKVGPYLEGDTLVLRCLVVGGKPSPHISWYSGDALVSASDGPSDVPGVKENKLHLTLTRDHTAPLVCRASNTALTTPVASTLQVEIYLPAENVTISWEKGATSEHTLQAGQTAVARCRARGSHPPPELSWWLDHKHLTPYSNQSWIKETNTAESLIEFTPTAQDNGATLSCIATNMAMDPTPGSKADVISLNVTFSPIIEVVKVGDEIKDIIELDNLHLECEVKANPPVERITWYFNDTEITPGGEWDAVNISGYSFVIVEAKRRQTGQYSCAALNAIGETRAHHISITVLYPPECVGTGISLVQETLNCNVNSLPHPDTYFWHVQASGFDIQRLTTGSSLLPLSQLLGQLSGMLHVVCEASNGIASQEKSCEKTLSLSHLRPPQPLQCDLAYEQEVFNVRCVPVENATYYELSVWKMSTSNTSLILERQGTMGIGNATALAQGRGETGLRGGWLVRGEVGRLREGDEAGASACNRFGCSRALRLRPTETLLRAAAPPWWQYFLEKDVGISVGAVVLMAAFVISTILALRIVRGSRRAKQPLMQVLQLDDVAREYLENIERKHHAACSARSCSSGYSGGSMESEPPVVDRERKPLYFWDPGPPPDVTLTLHRESAV